VEHARRGPYGGVVVPAPLITAVVMGLGAMDAPIPHTVALVGWSWRFKAPVRPGDSIRSRWRLNRKRDVEDARWGLVTWQVEVENQQGELVALGEVVRLVARREAAEVPEDTEATEGARSGRRRRRRRGGANGGAPAAIASQLAAESAESPDAVEVSPFVQPQEAELAAVTAPAESTPPPARRRRRRRGNGNGGAGQSPESPPAAPAEAAPSIRTGPPWSPPQLAGDRQANEADPHA